MGSGDGGIAGPLATTAASLQAATAAEAVQPPQVEVAAEPAVVTLNWPPRPWCWLHIFPSRCSRCSRCLPFDSP